MQGTLMKKHGSYSGQCVKWRNESEGSLYNQFIIGHRGDFKKLLGL